ncbi:histidine phosphatase family protein [Aliiroseovarius crassostreae]|uniref:histidine phosphatase family protein n=1 Tax=Aliiroseovarius crassostreae TaxID=154981 RepID=UPI003C7C4496
MRDYPELYVIRHGQTEWNRIGRHQGRLDSPLTEKGQGQARDMGRILARVVDDPARYQCFTSPQGRAVQTAEIALAGLGLSATPDDRLCEVAFGAWEGKTLEEIRLGWPELAALAEEDPVSWHFMSPGGETLYDLEGRADAFLQDLTGPAILFTHGILSRVLRARWLGVDCDGMLELPGGQGVIFHLSQQLGHVVLEK